MIDEEKLERIDAVLRNTWHGSSEEEIKYRGDILHIQESYNSYNQIYSFTESLKRARVDWLRSVLFYDM